MEAATNEQRRRLILAGLAAVPMVRASARASDLKPTAASKRLLKVDAKPAPITIDAAKTAVIVVDMENDFGSKGGMFDLAGIDISGIQKAVASTGRVLAAARTAGIRVVYLRMGYRPDLSDLDGSADDGPARPGRVRRRSRARRLPRAPVGRACGCVDHPREKEVEFLKF